MTQREAASGQQVRAYGGEWQVQEGHDLRHANWKMPSRWEENSDKKNLEQIGGIPESSLGVGFENGPGPVVGIPERDVMANANGGEREFTDWIFLINKVLPEVSQAGKHGPIDCSRDEEEDKYRLEEIVSESRIRMGHVAYARMDYKSTAPGASRRELHSRPLVRTCLSASQIVQKCHSREGGNPYPRAIG